MTLFASYNTLTIDTSHSKTVVVRINRPEVRNAITTELLCEFADLLDFVESDDDIHSVVITGSESVFAAGADLNEMAALDMVGVLEDPRPKIWNRIARFAKPIIAAVNGYALGAGCELAMHADIIIVGDNAQFGQPEINLGIIPGAGGTQRLIRTVGKSVAMKMVLAGEFLSASEAREVGLAAEVTPSGESLNRSLVLAERISRKSPLAVAQAKEVLLKSFETPLSAGLDYERKAFVMLAGSRDRNEGIQAFFEKRKPNFIGR